jgi:hypothetical protein
MTAPDDSVPEGWFTSPNPDEVRLGPGDRSLATRQAARWLRESILANARKAQPSPEMVATVEQSVEIQAQHHLGFVREIADFVAAKSGDVTLAGEIVDIFGDYRRRYLPGTDHSDAEPRE